MTCQCKKCKLFDPNPRVFLTNQVKYVQIPLKIHIHLPVMIDRLHCGYYGIHGCFRYTVSSPLPANLQ
jgi:hypothetical protein